MFDEDTWAGHIIALRHASESSKALGLAHTSAHLAQIAEAESAKLVEHRKQGKEKPR